MTNFELEAHKPSPEDRSRGRREENDRGVRLNVRACSLRRDDKNDTPPVLDLIETNLAIDNSLQDAAYKCIIEEQNGPTEAQDLNRKKNRVPEYAIFCSINIYGNVGYLNRFITPLRYLAQRASSE
jgi:hypothetical protein